MPLPKCVGRIVALIQSTLENEFHAHVLLAVTVMAPEPPPDPNDALPLASVVQGHGETEKALDVVEMSAKRGIDSVVLAAVIELSGA